jgi:hypothetical protein
LAIVLCLVSLIVAGPRVGTEARVAEAAIEAEDGTPEREDEDETVVALGPARVLGLIPASSDGSSSSPGRGSEWTGCLSDTVPDVSSVVAPAQVSFIGAALERPHLSLVQIILASVRPRGPTLLA